MFFSIIGKTNIDFIRLRKFAFALSAILLMVGFVALVLIVLEKANFGIDFSGGTEVSGWFEKPMTGAELRSALTARDLGSARIQTIQIGDTLAFLIKIKSGLIKIADQGETPAADTGMVAGLGEADKIGRQIVAAINSAFPDNHFHQLSSNITDPSIGRALKQQAVWLVLAAIAGILIYIWIRFDFRFGVTATIAAFHDMIVVLGIMYLLGRELSILIVTALLTLAGYSLTDTVVVFDRIRENLKTFRRKGDFVATVNLSINEVLSRTLMTGITTLVAVAVLAIFGGQVIFDFAITLIIGIFIGTYSSIFVASALMVEWENRAPKRFK